MTTIDYKEKYEQALERARQFSEKPYLEDSAGIVEYIFPELAESEDERIRKEIIVLIKDWWDRVNKDNISTKEQMIAWLEKQANHANFCNKIQIGDKVTRNEDGMLVNLSQLNRVAKPADKQCEQKPDDMVEPKFKVGDTIRLKNSTAEYTIESISGGCYHGKGWGLNIIDADKSGDYELVEQNSAAWSEDDNRILSTLTKYLEEHGGGIDGWECSFLSNWLKSLRPQNTWKPSDEQMEVLLSEVIAWTKGCPKQKILESLYNDLKKLREE